MSDLRKSRKSSPYLLNPFREWQRTIFFIGEKIDVPKTWNRVWLQEEPWSYRDRSPSVAILVNQMPRWVRFLLLSVLRMCPILCAQFAWIRINWAKSLLGPPVARMHFTKIVSLNTWPRKWLEARCLALRVGRNSATPAPPPRSHWTKAVIVHLVSQK